MQKPFLSSLSSRSSQSTSALSSFSCPHYFLSPPSSFSPFLSTLKRRWKNLVLRSGLLASLELIEIPRADGHVAVVLVEAAAEIGDIRLARAGLAVALLLALLLGGLHEKRVLLLLLLSGRGAGAAAEEAADCVSDRGADCDTTAYTQN